MAKKLNFIWNISEEEFRALQHDHKDRDYCEPYSDWADVYGTVSVGRLKFDIQHTLDENDWYPYVNAFVSGIDEGYGTRDDGTPYTLITCNDIAVPVRCKTLDAFKKNLEKGIRNFIENNEAFTFNKCEKLDLPSLASDKVA